MRDSPDKPATQHYRLRTGVAIERIAAGRIRAGMTTHQRTVLRQDRFDSGYKLHIVCIATATAGFRLCRVQGSFVVAAATTDDNAQKTQ